jgi:DNA-binding MarR family transcriptional regulator
MGLPSSLPPRHAALGEALRDTYVRFRKALDHSMMDRGTTLAKVQLLLFIDAHGEVRSTDIIEAFGHAPRTVTEGIDGLEKESLVTRVADPSDRRVKRISLTAEGKAVLAATEPARLGLSDRAFGVLEDDEIDTLVRLLGLLNDQLEILVREATEKTDAARAKRQRP